MRHRAFSLHGLFGIPFRFAQVQPLEIGRTQINIIGTTDFKHNWHNFESIDEAHLQLKGHRGNPTVVISPW